MQFLSKSFALSGTVRAWPLCLLLLAVVGLLYGSSLWNPLVFDDPNFFDGTTPQAYGHSIFHFDLRWFAYATLGWSVNIFGQDMAALRVGNLLLHATNAIVLFLFLRRLFDAVLPRGEAATQTLSHTWLAFFGALLFALHPVAVYATGYLIQRSILLATLFSWLSWYAYLEGLLRGQKRWFFIAAGFYFLAVFSKEHAVMAPAVALALTLLIYAPSRELFKKVALPFALFALIAVLITFKTKGLLGALYEGYAQDMLKRMSESQEVVMLPHDAAHPYPLSVVTQCFLFFKYLLLWLAPNPAWMSVDMREPFASSLLAWPQVLGVPAFLLYGAAALWLLLQRGKRGLLGFALLFPWLLFATELTTVRIQELFVLYRSYLWMGGLFAVLPVLLGNVPARRAFAYLLAASLLMAPLAWNRLVTFSHPLLLWDDAASLIEGRPYMPGFERIYHNRGAAFYGVGLKQRALDDYNRVIAFNPDYGYAYNNRGAVYFDQGLYTEALRDYNKCTELKPSYPRAYLGRGLLFEKLHNLPAARVNYQISCAMKLPEGCDMLHRMEGGG
ncbi:MAG: tetratricopeptide repeat protein [Nitrosomonadales bacterium]|nr:tetratricopeptide repeat protein [Nitrosomonadales bacterium]